MSKNKQTNVTTQGARTFNTKAFVISIVCILTALVIAVSLTIALWPKPADKTIADLDNPTVDSSSDTIKNGDFAYLEETDTLFPKSAQSWNKYSYKPKTSTSSNQYYQTITTNDQTVMGVVDVNDWDNVNADLTSQGINVANPGKVPELNDKDSNVYMISNKTSYSASIYSQSFSVSASSSARIVVYIKSVDVKGAGAFVMVKQNASYAQETSTSGDTYWYMTKGIKEGDSAITGTTEWTRYEFYFFNQSSSSKTLYVNVGLGNVYTGEGATGTIFIDDIKYESVTANDYRIHKDDAYTSYTVEQDSKDNDTDKLAFTGEESTMTAANYLSQYKYSPFVNETTIYKVSNDGKKTTPVLLTSNDVVVAGPTTGQHYHISFWVRVVNNSTAKLPSANIYLYDKANPDTALASFTEVRTSSELEKDTNNGWIQYHFYIKPAQDSKTLQFVVSFGDKNGYINTDAIPNGELLVTTATIENITQAEYGNATSGDYVSKITLGNTDTSENVTNASFSSTTNNSGTTGLLAPTGWSPAYAGAVELTKNGVDNITVNSKVGSVTSGVELNSSVATSFDDEKNAVLKITNNASTAFGYISSDITLSANSVYVLSVMARGEGEAKPSVYVIDQSSDNSVTTSFVKASASKPIADSKFNLPTDTTNKGWTRYYVVIATGDTDKTVNLVLFNGAIDATDKTTDKQQKGTVYFDKARADKIGSYTRDNTAEELYTKNDDGEWVLNEELVKEMTYTAESGYSSIKLDELLEEISKYDNIKVVDIRTTDVNVPEETTDDGDTDDTTDTTTPVDTTLIVSIVTSSLLLAALIIVVLLKFVFRKKHN